jgi:hypothetical protein
MTYCEQPVPVSYQDYMSLPEIDGIITPLGMDAFECGCPASCKFHGTWYCEEHMDAIEPGRGLIATHEEP